LVETLAAMGRADASGAGEEAARWGLEKSRAAAAKASRESGGGGGEGGVTRERQRWRGRGEDGNL
jgi:hypothetical protein